MLAASCSTLWSARAPRSSRAIRTAEPRKKLQIHALKKLSLQQNAKWAVQSLHEDIHGRRYITNVQRLRAGLHLHSCRSDVLPGTWLFDPKALQELPSGKKERSGGLWLPFCSGHGNTRDLFRLRPADNCAFRTPRRSSSVLPRLLPGTQRLRRCWGRRGIARPQPVLDRADSDLSHRTSISSTCRSSSRRAFGVSSSRLCNQGSTANPNAPFLDRQFSGPLTILKGQPRRIGCLFFDY